MLERANHIPTWGCERLNKQLTTVLTKRETDWARQIVSYGMKKKTGAPGMITTNFIFFDMDDRIERSKAGSKNRLIVDIGFGWNKLILFWIVIKIKTSIQ